jgi:hypothetical protein
MLLKSYDANLGSGMARALSSNFNPNLQARLKDIQSYKGRIESEASLSEVQRTRDIQERQLLEARGAEDRAEQVETEKRSQALIERMSAASVENDQIRNAKVWEMKDQSKHRSSDLDPVIQTWFKSESSLKLLWLKGRPGCGE